MSKKPSGRAVSFQPQKDDTAPPAEPYGLYALLQFTTVYIDRVNEEVRGINSACDMLYGPRAETFGSAAEVAKPPNLDALGSTLNYAILSLENAVRRLHNGNGN